MPCCMLGSMGRVLRDLRCRATAGEQQTHGCGDHGAHQAEPDKREDLFGFCFREIAVLVKEKQQQPDESRKAADESTACVGAFGEHAEEEQPQG